MDIAAAIRKIAEDVLVDPAQFVVDVSVSMRRAPYKITVAVDGDNGITIDDCATISRSVSSVLDAKALVDEAYTLEVTTPGLDQPIQLVRQYRKNIGRRLKINLSDVVIEGKLVAVADGGITVEQEIGERKKRTTETREIPFNMIDKSFVLVSFK